MNTIVKEKPTYIAAGVAEDTNAHLTFLFYGKRTTLATMLAGNRELSYGVGLVNELFTKAATYIKDIKLGEVQLADVEDFGEPGKPLFVRRVILAPSFIQARNMLAEEFISICERVGVTREELLSRPDGRYLYPYRSHISETEQIRRLSRVTLMDLTFRN